MLAEQRKDILRHVQEQYETVGKQLCGGLNAVYILKRILSGMLNDMTLPPTYLLINALDQCISVLLELLLTITNASLRQRPNVK
jgi:hypothetical protein